MERGWFKVYRKTLESDCFNKDLTAWHVFEVILMLVNKTTGTWEGGRFQLAPLCNLNPNTLYSALKRLEKKYKMITLSSNNKYTAINVVNWHLYNPQDNTKRQQQINNKSTTNQHSNKNKEVENKRRNTYATFFESFWSTYPSRNGKKLYKGDALLFIERNIKEQEFDSLLTATTNYLNSDMVQRGIGIKDAFRWLRNWKEWVTPENANSTNSPTRQAPSNRLIEKAKKCYSQMDSNCPGNDDEECAVCRIQRKNWK